MLFMDTDYLFPMTSVIEKTEAKERKMTDAEMLKGLEEFKLKMKDTIKRGVVYVKSGIFAKKQLIETILDKIVENHELISILFTEIVNYSLGVKKKYFRHFNLTGITPQLFTA